MHGSNKKCTQDFNQRKLKGRDHLLDLGIDVSPTQQALLALPVVLPASSVVLLLNGSSV
jgi:hypothetical protein